MVTDRVEKALTWVLYVCGILCVLLVIVLVAYVLPYGVVDASNQMVCVAAGYPEHVTTWNFEGYCSRFVDASQEIVPIEKVKNGK